MRRLLRRIAWAMPGEPTKLENTPVKNRSQNPKRISHL
jgi:hypothetical protein